MNDAALSPYQDTATIGRMLQGARRIAIVGLSANPLRASHFVGYYLQRHGFEVIPVNPREDEILGARSWPSVAALPEPVDIVNVFRDPSAVPEITAEAIAAGARGLWLQFGVISVDSAAAAAAAGLDVVMDRCLKVEHARYYGRMHMLGFNTGVISARRRPLPADGKR